MPKHLLALDNQKGNSLIEVIISLFIVMLIFQLTHIIAFATTQTVQARHNTSASLYAVSLIENIRAEEDLNSDHYQIAQGDNFMGITPPKGMEAQVLITPVANQPFLAVVKVSVDWIGINQSHQLVVESIIRREID